MKAMPMSAVPMLRAAAVATVCALALATVPAQGEEARLRAVVTVDGPVVTLGDLFEGAGGLAGTAVFRAPEPGTTGSVDTRRVLAAARQHGMSPGPAPAVDSVSVSRASREIRREDLAGRISERLTRDGLIDDAWETEVSLNDMDEVLHIEATSHAALTIRDLSYDRRSGRFMAMVVVSDSRTLANGLRVSGRAVEVLEVPVPARGLSRGEPISRSDISMQRVMRTDLRGDLIVDADDLVGMAVRRGLRAGVPVGRDSVMSPILVGRNDTVTIVYEVPGMTLSVRGRAIAAGSRGDVVPVINSQSNRTVEARITGPGQVAVLARQPVSAMLAAQP